MNLIKKGFAPIHYSCIYNQIDVLIFLMHRVDIEITKRTHFKKIPLKFLDLNILSKN